jgi:hypothetical protein
VQLHLYSPCTPSWHAQQQLYFFFYLINCRYYWALVTDEWMKSTQRRTYSSATLSTKNPTQTGPGISPCLHSFRLVTTLLKHDKASWYFQFLSRNKPVKRLINWKGFGKQWSCRYPCVCLEGLIDWLATGRTRKHLGLNCIQPFVRRLCVCFPPSSTGAPAPLRACGLLVGEPRTAQAEVCSPRVGEPRTTRAERSPLLVRKESFGREMACLIDSTST